MLVFSYNQPAAKLSMSSRDTSNQARLFMQTIPPVAACCNQVRYNARIEVKTLNMIATRKRCDMLKSPHRDIKNAALFANAPRALPGGALVSTVVKL